MYCGAGCTAAPKIPPMTAQDVPGSGRGDRLREVIPPDPTIALVSWGVWPSDDTYGTGQHGCQWSPEGSLNPGLPQSAPSVPVQMLVGPEDVFVQPLAPAGLRVEAPSAPTTFLLSRILHGLLYIGGVRSFNRPGEVEVVRLSVGEGSDLSRNATPFDSAAYNTSRCFCPVEWGCSDQIRITLRGLVPGAQLHWVVFGTLLQSWNSCYPTLGTVEAHAAAVWGMVHGRDGCDRANIEQWRSSLRTTSSSRPQAPTRGTLSSSSQRAGENAPTISSASPRSAAARSLASRLRRFLDSA